MLLLLFWVADYTIYRLEQHLFQLAIRVMLCLLIACGNDGGEAVPAQTKVEFTQSSSVANPTAPTTSTDDREWIEEQMAQEVKHVRDRIDKIETSPLVTEPCAPPCWQNITPGVTNIDEARKIIFGDVDPEKVCPSLSPYHSGSNVLLCDTFTIYAEDEHQPVQFISLWPRDKVTLAQVIERYGEPQKLYIGWTGLPDVSPRGVTITIPYPEHGLWLFFERDEEIYLVEPELTVQQMMYYAPGVPSPDPGYLSSNATREKPWVGYGDYYPYDDE